MYASFVQDVRCELAFAGLKHDAVTATRLLALVDDQAVPGPVDGFEPVIGDFQREGRFQRKIGKGYIGPDRAFG